MAFNEDFLVSQMLSAFKPKVVRPRLFAQGAQLSGQDGESRGPMGKPLPLYVPHSMRNNIKQNASMYGEADNVRALLFPGGGF